MTTLPTQPAVPGGHVNARERRRHELLIATLARRADERPAFLAEHCSDPTLIAEILALLARDGELAGFLARDHHPVASVAVTANPLPARSWDDWNAADTPTTIGPYQLLELLGEGGMGRVYLAEQQVPVRRKVALKLMRTSLTGATARARFDAERHAMARLGHPNVGRLFDAGTTDEGLPYFAMEWIEGLPLTDYCDAHHLGIDARTTLLVEVCRGVHHAHQKQVLHRDLKPSNVLVAEVDGKPVPKIIDFGIAKALDQPFDDALATGSRIIGTLDYLSPEAFRPGDDGPDLDTRSDVYSLGVMLYELLAGVRPFRSSGGSLTTAVERLATAEPPRPSTRLAAIDSDVANTIATQRGAADAADLLRRLRGDLDWIASKAIAPDRDLRYGSAAELADDLERALRHEPVAARPADRFYLLRQLARRHRGALVATGAVFLALLLGLGGTVSGLTRARTAEGEARAEAAAAAAARDEAEEVARFLVSLFRQSAPGQDPTRAPVSADALTARQILDHGSSRIAKELVERPRTQARIAATIGAVYDQLGLYEEAEGHLRNALALRERHLTPAHPDLAANHTALGRLLLRRGRLDEAAVELEAARAALEAAGSAAPPEVLADAFGDLGRLARQQGRFDDARALLERALAVREKHPGDGENELAVALNNLASLHFSRGLPAEAEPLYARAAAIFDRELPVGHPRRVQTRNNLAATLASQKRLDEAAPLFEQSLAERRALLGDLHPDVAESLNNLGVLRLDLDQPERAEPLLREALAIREQALGSNHPLVAWTLDNLASARQDQSDLGQAEALQRRALAIREAALGPRHADVGRSLHKLAELADAQGRRREAVDLFTRAVAVRAESLGAEHPETASSRERLAELGRPGVAASR